jgi:DNA recombination protein RmuC
VHLRRVVELAGLINHCDFTEQTTLREETKVWRPDLVVHLPGDRQIIVDAKTPIDSYIESFETKEESAREQKLKDHARHLRKHIKELSSKEYWKQLQPAPEYVILFLPAEAFFSAALQMDPTLIELGASENVIIASPTTLIAVLRAVAYGWKQESISKSAQEIANLGKELYERLGTMNDHWNRLGKNLSLSVDSYNQAISSLESRVLVSARKLKDLGAASGEKEFNLTQEINKTTKSLRLTESIGSSKEKLS